MFKGLHLGSGDVWALWDPKSLKGVKNNFLRTVSFGKGVIETVLVLPVLLAGVSIACRIMESYMMVQQA